MTVYRPAEFDGRPDPVIGHVQVGVLGSWASDPEVIGVFPELSATVITHAQEIKFYRGDSFNIGLQLQNDSDPPSAVDLGVSVVRFAAKQGYGLTNSKGVLVGNSGALILKRSYDPREIEIPLGTGGQAVIKIKKRDTLDHPLVPFVWDLEVTKAIEEVPSTGTVTVTAGSDTIMGTGASFGDLDLGDIIEVQGKRVLILDRIDDQNIQVDYSDWTSETINAAGPDCIDGYCTYVGRTRTVAFGPWTAVGDVIR